MVVVDGEDAYDFFILGYIGFWVVYVGVYGDIWKVIEVEYLIGGFGSVYFGYVICFY